MADGAFETWAAGVIYNNQPLTERKGIPYFLASKAHAAGVAEGIRQAREAVDLEASRDELENLILDVGSADYERLAQAILDSPWLRVHNG